MLRQQNDPIKEFAFQVHVLLAELIYKLKVNQPQNAALISALDEINNELIDDVLANKHELKKLDSLGTINHACSALLSVDPELWENNDDFALNYKNLFLDLSKDQLNVIGQIYPYRTQDPSSLQFEVSSHDIRINRFYPRYTNIAYEGGGVKGIAYSGANRALAEKNIMKYVKRVTGSSAGAITAALVAVGYGHKDFTAQINSVDFKKLQDITNPGGFLGSLFGSNVGLAKELLWGAAQSNEAIHNESFVNSGRALLFKLREVIGLGVKRLIKRATDKQKHLMSKFGILTAVESKRITFLDLNSLALICPEENIKTLIITGAEKVTDSQTRLILFSALHSPRTEIALALRISASVPKFFRSVTYNNKKCIDGGVIENLPFIVFARPEYQDENVQKSAITQTIAFKFFSPGEQDKLHFPHQPSETKRGEMLILPELAPHLAENRNIQGQLIRSDLAPLIIPISTEGIESTNFSLTDEEKKRLDREAYEKTVAMLNIYAIESRAHRDDRVFSNFKDAIATLSLSEVKELLERIKISQLSKSEDMDFILVDNKIPEVPPISIKEMKELLEVRLKTLQLKIVEDDLSVEEKIDCLLQDVEIRREKLITLLYNNGSAAIFTKLRRDVEHTQKLSLAINLNLTSFDGAVLANIITSQLPLIKSADKNNVEIQTAINNIQDHLCNVIAKEFGFNDMQEVKNEIFDIKNQEANTLWPRIVNKNNGFTLDLLKDQQIIQYIQSLSAYQELQSWAQINSSSDLAENLEIMFQKITNGHKNWYTSLLACSLGLIVPNGPNFSESELPTLVHMIRLYYNHWEGKNNVNIQPLLKELVEEVTTFIEEHLLLTRKDHKRFKEILAKLPTNALVTPTPHKKV